MSKQKFIFIQLIAVVLINCTNQRNETLPIRDVVTYEIFNAILNDSTEPYIEFKNVIISEVDFLGPPVNISFNREIDFLMHLFNEKDSMNIRLQFRLRKEFHIDSTRIGLHKILAKEYFVKDKMPRDSMWNHVYEKNRGGFTSISMPIFSSDNKLAYIRIGHFCGDLCGGGESRLYIYKNGKWEKIKSFSEWIS
jgi:hypothetical protein